MLLEVIGILVVLWLVYKVANIKYDHWRYSHLPGPPRESFFLGNAPEFRRRLLADGSWGPFWLDMVREHGIIFRFWMVMKPIVFVADPLSLKEMVSDFKTYPKIRDGKGFIARRWVTLDLQKMYTQRFCGHNSLLTTVDMDIWRRKKRIMDPAFSKSGLARHLTEFYNIGIDLCDNIEAKQEETPGEPIDVTSIVGPASIDAISRAGFSATDDEMERLRDQGGDDAFDLTTQLMSKAGSVLAMVLDSKTRKIFVKYADGIKRIRKLGAQMIMERTSGEKHGRVGDILDYIISANTDDNSGRFDMEEGLDDFMTMYAAGNATTSTTLLWCLGQLTRNPGVMDKLVDEIDEVWGAAGVDRYSNPKLIEETHKDMPYLGAFLKEVLRHHSPITRIHRTALKTVNLCGFRIPAMTSLMGSQHVMHLWDKFWDDPEKFEPDRFLTSTPKPYTYVPFFLGPRACTGKDFAILELKCFLCELLSRFTVELDPNAPPKQRSAQVLICVPIDNSFIFKPRL
ncbi:cholesterol 24-hydroxylase-like [Bolinopsis microptera]|uniref:cholesterol 24-hydroxylase-like n=1 Tax=Bolinopsis microptera TaxID=2820187 RepID=UPI0030793CDC